LRNNAQRFKELLQKSSHLAEDLPSISYTYMVGRSHFEHRLSLVGNSKEMEAGLDEFLAQKEEETPKFSGGAKRYYTSTTNAPAKISLFFFVHIYFFMFLLTTAAGIFILCRRPCTPGKACKTAVEF